MLAELALKRSTVSGMILASYTDTLGLLTTPTIAPTPLEKGHPMPGDFTICMVMLGNGAPTFFMNRMRRLRRMGVLGKLNPVKAGLTALYAAVVGRLKHPSVDQRS